ncbi:hypothetical protein AB0J83_03940 [Actinoplanes sp. NPDC049596]|uniref:hypothetical protein n=1 Tax=unclassified Actinoplanes TaxID=2626549 RepID=UPI003448F9DC
MNDIKFLDPALGHEPTPEQWARSRAFVERTMAERRVPARRGRMLTVGAVAAAAGVVAAVVVPAVLPGAGEKAIASWTAMPSARTGEQVMPQAATCGAGDTGGPPGKVSPSDVILAEQRGDMTLLILRKNNGALVECLSVDKDRFASMGLTDGVTPPPAAAPDSVTLETRSSAGDGDNLWSNIVGLAGPEVTAVEIRLDRGKTFQASVRNGWWGAWWPGPEGGDGPDTFTVVVHTARGTTELRPSQLP